jgi:predicted acylesterase/phospholipase RssA
VRAIVSEPLRGPKRRLREARILGAVVRKHRMLRASGLDAAILEFVLTARFDTLSHILQRIRSAYVFDARPLVDRLYQATRGRDPNATGVRLAINTVDVRTGGIVRFVNHRPEKRAKASVHYRYVPTITPEIVLASASIPLLFNPVTTSTGDLCWDGGLLVNTPLAPTVALGAQRIIPVLVTPRRKLDDGEMATFGSAIERLADSFLENAYNADRKLLLDRNDLAAKLGDPMLRTVELFRAIRPASSRTFDAGSYLYFERDALLAMYREGRRAATRWLEEGPEIDGREDEDA